MLDYSASRLIKFMNKMTEEIKQKLKANGRGDLVKTFDVIQSGYAGTMPNGNIVDRREFPDAIPVQENQLLNAPKPREIKQVEQI